MRVIQKNRAIFRLFTALVILVVASTGIWLLIQLFSWADRHDRREHLRQKECWKEIYFVIEKSPKDKAEWIKETISHRRLLLGGVDYGDALEFDKNGHDK